MGQNGECVCAWRGRHSQRWGEVFFWKWGILTSSSGVCEWWKSVTTQVDRDISSWATDHYVIPISDTRPKSEPRNFFTSMWLGRIYVNLTDYEIPVKDEGIKSGHCFQEDCENLVLHITSSDHSYHYDMTVFIQWNLSSVTEDICFPLSSSTCTSCSWLENLHKSFLFVVVL